MLRTLFPGITLLALALAPSAARADLVAHLPFDGDVADATGNGNDGTFVGDDLGPTFVDGFDGAAGGAVSFDGVDDYVFLTQSVGLPVTVAPEFTIAMWVNGAVQRDRRVFSEGSSTNNTPLFNLGTHNNGSNGALNSFLRPGPGHRQTAAIAFDESWHHIAWVDRNGRVDVYVDGVRDAVPLDYDRVERALDTTSIGAILRGGPCCFFAGAIDDVRIYDNALSEAEVQALIPAEGCPAAGDTHCDGLDIVDNGFGGIVATASATDDGGDTPLLYTFTVSDALGIVEQVGPQEENVAEFQLGIGTWTIACAIDDDLACFDRAEDAACSAEVTITSPAPQLIGHWPFDGDLLDVSGKENHGTFVGGVAPMFVDGWDGTPEGAVQFDGLDDFVDVDQNLGLPIYSSPAYTVAMWVKGGLQPDMRVFSEGSTTSNNPLLNVGTDNTGSTGKLDIFIRNGPTLVGHAKSNREAFDESWHHIAWVDDNGRGLMYIDGALEPNRIEYARAGAPFNTTTIGAILRASPSHWFTGTIDDVRVFNFALSAEEIRELIPEPDDCPAEADTRCDALEVTGPEDRTEGTYTITMTASDDSGDDPLWYTFLVRSADDGAETQIGPQPSNTAEITLAAGSWSVTATVDDSFLCRDSSPDATCETDVEVLAEPEMLISAWSFDGDLLDSEPAGNHGEFVGGDSPTFVTGFDCTTPGAVQFDGADDFVRVISNDGFPVTGRSAFTIAMWVKGPPQNDKRIFSESNTQGNNSTLFNLGTDNTGATGVFDFFYRDDNGRSTGHLKSEGIAFDDTWHHVAWVDVLGQVTLYIDGQPDPADLSYARSTLTLDTTTIGGILRGGPCCLFNGSIDDVRVYNFALDQDEVLEIIGDGALECCPSEGDAEFADTHCVGIEVLPVGGDGTHALIASAVDETGDPVSYTFTARRGDEEPIVVGPQPQNEAEVVLAPGDWTITVTVDDDPECDDTADDATCVLPVTICPEEGDTHCTGLEISGPAGNLPGEYTLTASATDDSGDTTLLYTFVADDGTDVPENPIVIGPQEESTATVTLHAGAWTISVTVDDDPDCRDEADDATCEQALVVEEPGGLQLPGDCNQDGTLDISDATCVFGVLFLGNPTEFPCGDGTPANAANLTLLDWQDDAEINISDGISILLFLFSGGEPHILGGSCVRVVDCDEVCVE